MSKTRYIHYGSKEYDPDLFLPIVNTVFNKPKGGLWASDVKAEYGWKDWNQDNDFVDCKEDNSFTFTLSDNARIIHIYSVDDLKKLPRINKIPSFMNYFMLIYLDFEELLNKGYDAIELHLSEDETKRSGELYWVLYGWDCDSILVLNKHIIIPD